MSFSFVSNHAPLRNAYLTFGFSVASILLSYILMQCVLYPGLWLTPLNMLDHQAMVLLNFDGGPVADRFFYRYSHLNWWLPLAVVTVCYTIGNRQLSWRNRLMFILLLAVMLTFSDQLTSSIIKPLVGRFRPSHDMMVAPLLHYVGDYRGGCYGFVSGHAANICCLATLLAYIYRSRAMRLMLLVFALTMCYSRIYLGVHYPGDIFCGAAIGIGIAWLAIKIAPKNLLPRYNRVPWGIIVVWAATVAVMLF